MVRLYPIGDESEYGEDGTGLRLGRHGDAAHVTLIYPQNNKNPIKHVHFDQESVRATGGIRVSFDYDRNEFVIEQPRWDPDETWVEVAALPAILEDDT